MSYVFLLIAILSEVAGTTMLKLSDGFTKIIPTVIALLCYLITLGAMSLTYKHMSIGFAYAVWSGLGISLVTIVGIVLFKDPIIWQKFLFISFIVVGVVGLNILSKA